MNQIQNQLATGKPRIERSKKIASSIIIEVSSLAGGTPDLHVIRLFFIYTVETIFYNSSYRGFDL